MDCDSGDDFKAVSTEWMRLVDFQVAEQFVEPIWPRAGETVRLSIRIPAGSPVQEGFVVAYLLGRVSRFRLRSDVDACEGRRGAVTYWRTELTMPKTEGLYWWFELKTGDCVRYYASEGFRSYVPPLRECFRLEADLDLPGWVPGSVCYQIFPDRFRKGDPSVGVRPGQYEFDGGKPRVLDWNDPPLDFEQGRCLDFYNGDLKGIERSVEHFKRLGVSVLYLNPIGVSHTTHRYDCCDFFHVDDKLGGDDALVELIETMHANGIRVIVDISINHTGTGHPWFIAARENPDGEEASFYYREPDGSFAFWEGVPTLPQLNYGSGRLRDVMYRNSDSVLRKFLEPPFNQDGWRLDVADVVGRRKDDQFCHEIWREVRKAVKATSSQAYLVAEDWIDASDHLQGDEWDATMNYYGSSRPIRRWMGETDRFQLPGWGHDPVPGSYFSGRDLAEALDRQLKSLPPQMVFQQFNLIDSHDTPRLHTNEFVADRNLYRGAVMLLFLLPGMPSVYYGDEVGLEGKIGSVEASRYPMQWDRAQWDMDVYRLYRDLGLLKRSEPALAFGAWKILHADEDAMVFARYDGKRAIVLVLNKNPKPSDIIFDAGVLSPTNVIRWSDGTLVEVSDSRKIRISLKPKESELLLVDQER